MTTLVQQTIADPDADSLADSPAPTSASVLARLAASPDSVFEARSMTLLRLLNLQFAQHPSVQAPSEVYSLVFAALDRIVDEDMHALAEIKFEVPMPTIVPNCVRNHGKSSLPSVLLHPFLGLFSVGIMPAPQRARVSV